MDPAPGVEVVHDLPATDQDGGDRGMAAVLEGPPVVWPRVAVRWGERRAPAVLQRLTAGDAAPHGAVILDLDARHRRRAG